MKIKRIVEIVSEEPVYDIEVDTADHTFMIQDVRVENCRLLSDTSKLDAFINSIGGTALSVGSCRVSTINLARIAYEAKGSKKKYMDILEDRVLLDCKALTSMRHIIERNIEKGLLPNYQDGALELDKQYCTIGIIGMFEVMDMFGLIAKDEFGYESYTDEALEFAEQIMHKINEIKDNFECDFSFNVENIPGENTAGTLCTADNLLFRDGSDDWWVTTWYTLKIDGERYRISDKTIVTVTVYGKPKEVTFAEAKEKDYDIDIDSLCNFKF